MNVNSNPMKRRRPAAAATPRGTPNIFISLAKMVFAGMTAMVILSQHAYTVTAADASAAADFHLNESVTNTPNNEHRRMQEAAMEGSCTSSKLEAGQQQSQGNYLCYPMNNPVYKFGIDSSNQLSYFANDKLIWSATPPPPTTSACIVFGSCDVPLHFVRLQNGGSLAAYDNARKKVWDSHVDGGDYSDYAQNDLGMASSSSSSGAGLINVLSEKRTGSTLELNEKGVFIYDDDSGGVVTWKIDAPPVEETADPTSKPSKSPTTSEPTKKPTTQPTKAALGSIQGFVWNDSPTNGDGVYNSGDLPLGSIVVTLASCENDGGIIESISTKDDGTFLFDDVEEGSYRLFVIPPVGKEGATPEVWKFVTKNVNGNNNANAVAEDSDVNPNGTSDCINISAGDSALQHSIYVGLVKEDDTSTPPVEEITVSGSIFLDSNGDGLNNDDGTGSEVAILEGLVIDLYDCADPSNPKWVLLTRADSGGEFQFRIPVSSVLESAATTTPDLTSLLEKEGVTQLSAVVSLPEASSTSDGGKTTYAFSPPSKDSDVDPANGQTACWDMETNGKGSIVWNAGITMEEEVPAPAPTPTPKPVPATPTRTSAPTSKSPGVIGGYAFFDSNNDGIRNPNTDVEPPMTNINVRLYSCTPPSQSSLSAASGFLSPHSDKNNDEEDELLAMQRTNAQGFYSFRNLFKGYYRVVVQPPSGYTMSPVWSGNADDNNNSGNIDNAVNPATKSTECMQNIGGDTDISWDVGMVYDIGTPTRAPSTSAPVVASPVIISGMVFHDLNNNGYLDTNEGEESAMSDVQVALFDCNGAIYKLSTTDKNGLYGFEDVPPGSYVVKFSAPAGYQLSDVWNEQLDEEGKLAAPDADSKADPSTSSTTCREFKSGESELSLGAAMYLPGTAAPTPKPTSDPGGDGTPCSGAKCPVEGMCRNQAGLCGAGISFCNPSSVWESSCPEKQVTVPSTPSPVDSPAVTSPPSTAAPTVSMAPTTSPTNSTMPTISSVPSASPTVAVSVTEKGSALSICNADGSVGTTSNMKFAGQSIQEVEIRFTYALKSTNGLSPDTALLAKFEEDLQKRMSCIYFDDECLACDGNGGNGSSVGLRRRNLMAQIKVYSRIMVEIEDSSMVGITSLPPDQPNPVEVCAGTTTDCRVIAGRFTAYFPKNLDASVLEEEKQGIMNVVESELNKNDWVGMQVSYNNEPFPAASLEESENGDTGGSGVSIGAIIGIVVGVVVLLAVLAVSAILFIRNRRDKDDEEFELQAQQHLQNQRVVPYGNAEESLGSKDLEDDDYESSDDSSSSSSSSDSSIEDDLGSGSISSPSAISGDTFPTNVAQARPQDLDDDESSDSSEEGSRDESYDEESETGISGPEQDVEHIQRLQQSAASDEAPPIYEDGGDGYDGEYDGNYADDNQGYDNANYEGQYDNMQISNYNEQDGGGYPQNYGNPEDEGDLDSVTSGDPPGTSYRDLPQEDDWDGAMMAPQQQQQIHMMNGNMMNSGGFVEEYYEESQEGSFHVYESDGSDAFNNSYHEELDEHSNHSNPGSYHSNQSGHGFDGSHRSVHSHRSAHSNHSHRSAHSNHSARSHASRHSEGGQEQDDHDDQQHYDDQQAYGNSQEQEYDQQYHNEQYHDGQQDYGSPQDYNEQDYGQQYHDNQQYNDGQQDYGSPQDYNEQDYGQQYHDNQKYNDGQQDYGGHNNQYSQGYADEGQFDDAMGEGNQYDTGYNGMAGAYSDHDGRGGGGGMMNNHDGFDEASYHSFNPVPSSNSAPRPEELDEISHAGSGYSATTHQTSNRSGSRPRDQEGRNVGGNQEITEEEESISNIFKSLSEIQTRLASKGGQEQAIPGDMYQAAPNAYEPVGGGSWGNEGIVEDVSVDGSQVSNYHPTRNRRPQQGEWIEPINEGEEE